VHCKIIAFTAAALGATPVSGCADVKATCVSAGICDAPPAPTFTIDIVCDSSAGSTCTKEAIAETLDGVLPALVERPGSTLRLWSMSGTVDGVVTLGIITSPETASAARAREREQDAFVKAAKTSLLLSVDGALAHPAPQSPIADTLARVLMAAAGDERRSVVLISDMREFQKGRYDFECGPLPSPADFTQRLVQERVLTRESMNNVAVAFTYVGVPAVDGRRCEATIQRARDIEAIWRGLVTSTGGTVIAYVDGPIQAAMLSR
jgi:hypothetical protein